MKTKTLLILSTSILLLFYNCKIDFDKNPYCGTNNGYVGSFEYYEIADLIQERLPQFQNYKILESNPTWINNARYMISCKKIRNLDLTEQHEKRLKEFIYSTSSDFSNESVSIEDMFTILAESKVLREGYYLIHVSY